MQKQGMPHTVLSGEEVRKRFPQFNLTDADHAVYQADGGLVDARKGNAVHIALARVHSHPLLCASLLYAYSSLQATSSLSAGQGCSHQRQHRC
jgi:hypothetical protein